VGDREQIRAENPWKGHRNSPPGNSSLTPISEVYQDAVRWILTGILMKAAFIFFLLALSALAQQEQPVPATIEGILLNFETGSPMANVPMRFSSMQSPAGRGGRGARTANPDFAMNTDSLGRFTFKGIEPGQYRLEPGAGFVYAGFQRDFTATILTISSGQDIRGLRLPVAKLSTVSGRIVDQNDQGQAGVTVEAYELVYSVSGEKYLGQPRGLGTRTDANGFYRLTDVEAGELYLVARPLANRPMFPVTYYPGVVDAENAVSVRVSGPDTGGIDIRLGFTDLRSIRVKVPRPPGVGADLKAVFLISTPSRGAFKTALMQPSTLAPQFEALPNDMYRSSPLPPDDYIVDVTWAIPNFGGAAAVLMGARFQNPKARFTVRLEDKDADAGTVVTWSTPSSISGKVFASGIPQPPDFSGFNISLASAEPIADSARLPFAADGTFKLATLMPGRYSVRATTLPDGLHLVSARFSGREIVDTVFNVEANSTGPFEFTVAPGAGSIEGTVATAKDEPVTFGRVVLVPSLNRRGNPNLFVSVFTDETGAFSFKGVPPGDYTLIAWEWVRLYSYLNPAVLSEFEGRGKKITVAPGSQNRVTLQAIAGSR
jgi:hypothetical protein